VAGPAEPPAALLPMKVEPVTVATAALKFHRPPPMAAPPIEP
jgi:hypothetical protein